MTSRKPHEPDKNIDPAIEALRKLIRDTYPNRINDAWPFWELLDDKKIGKVFESELWNMCMRLWPPRSKNDEDTLRSIFDRTTGKLYDNQKKSVPIHRWPVVFLTYAKKCGMSIKVEDMSWIERAQYKFHKFLNSGNNKTKFDECQVDGAKPTLNNFNRFCGMVEAPAGTSRLRNSSEPWNEVALIKAMPDRYGDDARLTFLCGAAFTQAEFLSNCIGNDFRPVITRALDHCPAHTAKRCTFAEGLYRGADFCTWLAEHRLEYADYRDGETSQDMEYWLAHAYAIAWEHVSRPNAATRARLRFDPVYYQPRIVGVSLSSFLGGTIIEELATEELGDCKAAADAVETIHEAFPEQLMRPSRKVLDIVKFLPRPFRPLRP